MIFELFVFAPNSVTPLSCLFISCNPWSDGDSEVDEIQYLNDGRVRNFSASDSGIAVGFGVDYAGSDSLNRRADFVSYSADKDVLNIGPIYHF